MSNSRETVNVPGRLESSDASTNPPEAGPLNGLTEREAMELAYGLLWMVPIDTHTVAGRLNRAARLALGNALGHEGKRSGLERAQLGLEILEPSRRHS